jgi:hypothetical protein
VVPGDTNGFADVFVADRIDGTIRRASVTDEGLQADGPSGAPALAADGRWVLFESSAANLRAQAVGAPLGLFARGLTPGAETTVALPAPTAVAAGTVTHPAISAGGERVAWLGGVAGDLVGLSSWQTAGADTLEGGPGDDVFLLNREAQLVEADGGGVDAVITDAPRHVLAEHVENLAYRGHGSFHGVGNSLGNLIGGGGGDDLLDGLTGPQRDTVRYAGARAAFEVQVLQAADHATDRAVRVRDGSGAQGTDTLLSIERLVFDDLTLAFDTAPGEAAATAFALWHAAFGRAPLPSEIGRWIDALDGGAAADSVAASMLQAYAPSVPNVLLVQVLYTNIVGSPPPDAQAIAPFVEPLDQGLLTQAQLFAAAAASALNEVRIAGLVADGVAFESWAG